MKRFILLIVSAIMTISFTSCGGKVEKDIKSIVGGNVKVCAVKSIDIKEDFYQYTEEYNRFLEQNKYWGKEQVDWGAAKIKWENLFKDYPATKEKYKKDYDEVLSYYQESVDSVTFYFKKCETLKKSRREGKLYVAKLLGRNEYTNKRNDYNSYSIFARNSDGTLQQVDAGNNMEIIFSVYPSAKKDMKKVMGTALGTLLDGLDK